MRSGRLKCYSDKQLWSGGGSLLVNYYSSWDALILDHSRRVESQVFKWCYANIMDIMAQSETNWIYP